MVRSPRPRQRVAQDVVVVHEDPDRRRLAASKSLDLGQDRVEFCAVAFHERRQTRTGVLRPVEDAIGVVPVAGIVSRVQWRVVVTDAHDDDVRSADGLPERPLRANAVYQSGLP
jgi:hypothetical protein